MDERRLAKVGMTFELLRQWITKGNRSVRPFITTEGVPPDAVYIGSEFDARRMEAYLIFYHPSFEALQNGEEIPLIDVLLKTYYNPEAEALYLADMDADKPEALANA